MIEGRTILHGCCLCLDFFICFCSVDDVGFARRVNAEVACMQGGREADWPAGRRAGGQADRHACMHADAIVSIYIIRTERIAVWP